MRRQSGTAQPRDHASRARIGGVVGHEDDLPGLAGCLVQGVLRGRPDPAAQGPVCLPAGRRSMPVAPGAGVAAKSFFGVRPRHGGQLAEVLLGKAAVDADGDSGKGKSSSLPRAPKRRANDRGKSMATEVGSGVGGQRPPVIRETGIDARPQKQASWRGGLAVTEQDQAPGRWSDGPLCAHLMPAGDQPSVGGALSDDWGWGVSPGDAGRGGAKITT